MVAALHIPIHHQGSLQNVEQILIWIKSVLFCGFDHDEDNRAALCAAGRLTLMKKI